MVKFQWVDTFAALIVPALNNAFSIIIDYQIPDATTFYSREDFYNREDFLGAKNSSDTVFQNCY